MRVKVAEALAMGKAVVGSPLAFAGLEPRHAVEAMVAASDDEFVAAVAELLADGGRRAALGRAARALAVSRLGQERTAAAYGALYAALLARVPVERGHTSCPSVPAPRV
jgi:glycosyltransferase involved in cell wall biosynthesis